MLDSIILMNLVGVGCGVTIQSFDNLGINTKWSNHEDTRTATL